MHQRVISFKFQNILSDSYVLREFSVAEVLSMPYYAPRSTGGEASRPCPRECPNISCLCKLHSIISIIPRLWFYDHHILNTRKTLSWGYWINMMEYLGAISVKIHISFRKSKPLIAGNLPTGSIPVQYIPRPICQRSE